MAYRQHRRSFRMLWIKFSGLDHAMCYLDDILIASSNQEKHETILEEVLQRLERHNIRVNTSKCSFMEASVEYLSHLRRQMLCLGAHTQKPYGHLRTVQQNCLFSRYID